MTTARRHARPVGMPLRVARLVVGVVTAGVVIGLVMAAALGAVLA